MALTDLQQEVVEKAKAQLKDEPWFRGLCLDELPWDKEIERDGVDACADQLVIDTAMWDDPNFLSSANVKQL